MGVNITILSNGQIALYGNHRIFKKRMQFSSDWSKSNDNNWTYENLVSPKMDPGSHVRTTEFRFHCIGNIILKLKEMQKTNLQSESVPNRPLGHPTFWSIKPKNISYSNKR